MDAPQAVTALSALGHETRLALFRLLVERGPDGLPAGAIAERLGIPPSSLTFHLQHLHRAGLVTQRRRHRQLIYAADFAAMNGLVLYLTDNCCGRGSAAQLFVPACNPPVCNTQVCNTAACDPVDVAPAMPRDAAA
jgi:ArsR family transcriptional regulator